METITDSLVPLEEVELKRVIELARKRNESLSRGRAVFTCTTTEAGAAEEHPSFPPACARMEYHWESETVWQARAWDAEGNLLSDTASDGEWVEAGGKRWHIDFLLDRYGWDSDSEASEARLDKLVSEFTEHMRYRSVCEGHLFLGNLIVGFGSKRNLFRDAVNGHIVYQMRTFKTMYSFEFKLWDRLRWRASRLFNRNARIEDSTYVPPRELESDSRIYFDATHLHPLFTTVWSDNSEFGCWARRNEQWHDPTRIDDVAEVAGTYETHTASEESLLLGRSDLVIEDSVFGESASLKIRPVDYGLPAVES